MTSKLLEKTEVDLPSAGLDVSKPAEYIDVRNFRDVQNMEYNQFEISKRLGKFALGSSLAERIQGIKQLQVGSNYYIVRIGLTKTELLDQNANTWSNIGHAVWTGTSADRLDFAFPILTGAKIMVMTNGVDAIRKYTGAGNTAVLGGSPPLARYCVAYGGYLVLFYTTEGGTTYYLRARWSDTGLPETWAGGNAGASNLLEDEDDITGVGVFGDYITIHKQGSIFVGYLVSTSQVFRFDRKNTGAGAISHDTIRNLPTGEQIFLARDGFRLFNGITAPLIDNPVMDELRTQMAPQYLFKATAVVVKERDEYWCGIPLGSQTEPETVYKYNYRTGHVYKDLHTNLTILSQYERINKLSWDDKSNTWDSDTTRWDDVIYLALAPTVIFGDTVGNTTRREPIYNDSGVAISSFEITKDFTCKDVNAQLPFGTLMRWKAMHIWAKGNTMTLQYSIDHGTSWNNITTQSGGATFSLPSDYPPDSAPIIAYFDVVSTEIRFKFSNAVINETFTLKKYHVDAKRREFRK